MRKFHASYPALKYRVFSAPFFNIHAQIIISALNRLAALEPNGKLPNFEIPSIGI